MTFRHWKKIVEQISREGSEEEALTWLGPLAVRLRGDALTLYAPNQVVEQRVKKAYLKRIGELAKVAHAALRSVELLVGHPEAEAGNRERAEITAGVSSGSAAAGTASASSPTRVDPRYRFDNFVEGAGNRMARASCLQVASRQAFYNPLVLYGDTGLGKTHLMHAIGNLMLAERPQAKVLYVRSEDFFNGMVRALQQGKIDEFKSNYRSLEALLIDDIQFFARKDRTQEEFFHTFNALYDNRQQIILTCDRYPKELEGLEQRLKSRFGWGLSIGVEPPDFETRTAILLSKAAVLGIALDEEGAQLIARRMRASSNVRELEGALYTLSARANLTGCRVDADFIQEALRDQFSVADRQVSVGNIQKVSAEYFRLPLSDLLGKKRTRPVARARQVSMALCKELTTLSLKEIGQNFGGRDHTTVLHACRLVQEWQRTDATVREDWEALKRRLSV